MPSSRSALECAPRVDSARRPVQMHVGSDRQPSKSLRVGLAQHVQHVNERPQRCAPCDRVAAGGTVRVVFAHAGKAVRERRRSLLEAVALRRAQCAVEWLGLAELQRKVVGRLQLERSVEHVAV